MSNVASDLVAHFHAPMSTTSKYLVFPLAFWVAACSAAPNSRRDREGRNAVVARPLAPQVDAGSSADARAVSVAAASTPQEDLSFLDPQVLAWLNDRTLAWKSERAELAPMGSGMRLRRDAPVTVARSLATSAEMVSVVDRDGDQVRVVAPIANGRILGWVAIGDLTPRFITTRVALRRRPKERPEGARVTLLPGAEVSIKAIRGDMVRVAAKNPMGCGFTAASAAGWIPKSAIGAIYRFEEAAAEVDSYVEGLRDVRDRGGRVLVALEPHDIYAYRAIGPARRGRREIVLATRTLVVQGFVPARSLRAPRGGGGCGQGWSLPAGDPLSTALSLPKGTCLFDDAGHLVGRMRNKAAVTGDVNPGTLWWTVRVGSFWGPLDLSVRARAPASKPAHFQTCAAP